jgi:predicted nucleic acid-binding protein
MTRSELLLWPRVNTWGQRRKVELWKHVDLCTTLFPDDDTCEHWADIVAESRKAGCPITVADAWIAATGRQWDIPLLTTDFRDFEHLANLTIVPVS